MKRKIIQLGGSTLVVSLPSKWVKSLHLTAGTEIDIEQDGAQLIINADPTHHEQTTTILTFSQSDWFDERPEKFVQRMLATAYKRGIDEIIVRSESKHILDYVEKRIDSFIGVEVVDQKPNELVIKNLVEAMDMQFDAIFQRILLLTSHIAKETVQAVQNNDQQSMENILRLERTHNKLIDFAKRIIARRQGSREDKYVYSFVVENERLVDEYKYLIKIALVKKLSQSKVNLFEEIANYMDLVVLLTKKSTKKNIVELSAQYIPLREKILSQTNSPFDVHLHNVVVKSYELGETLLEWKGSDSL